MKIEGTIVAQEIYTSLESQIGPIPQKRVTFISFEKNAASDAFVNVKLKAATKLGIDATVVYESAANNTEAIELVKKISKQYDGVVVQLPLPTILSTQLVLDALPEAKDIDVLGAATKQAFVSGATNRIPPVAHAVWQVLAKTAENLIDKNIVILGKGRLVGEPIAMLLEKNNIPYRAYDKDSDQSEMFDAVNAADIIITGLGSPHFVKPDMIKDGVVLIDAGTSEQGGKLAGDIDPVCYAKASYYTPVPGGIGPITVACLYWNLFN